MTPASRDPEYVWLRKDALHSDLIMGIDPMTGNAEPKKVAPTEAASHPKTKRITNRFAQAGVLGVVLQCLGLLWLLSAVGFSIPWYSIFPVATMGAGGVFIIRAIIHGRERIVREAYSDRCDHQRY